MKNAVYQDVELALESFKQQSEILIEKYNMLNTELSSNNQDSEDPKKLAKRERYIREQKELLLQLLKLRDDKQAKKFVETAHKN